MANLIPPIARNIVAKEYWMRAISVWLFLIAASCVIITILMIPTYMLVGVQQNTYTNHSDDIPITQAEFEEMSERVIETNELAHYLDQNNEHVSINDRITEIDTVAGEEISVLEYHFTQESLSISGVAANRTALVHFRDTLSAHEQFSEVVLPLSNLAGDRDISFSMQIMFDEN